MRMSETPQQAITEIDLDAIVRARMGRKARYVPQWAINALKRLIHQDFINAYLRQGLEGVSRGRWWGARICLRTAAGAPL